MYATEVVPKRKRLNGQKPKAFESHPQFFVIVIGPPVALRPVNNDPPLASLASRPAVFAFLLRAARFDVRAAHTSAGPPLSLPSRLPCLLPSSLSSCFQAPDEGSTADL